MARVTNDQHLAEILKTLDQLTDWEKRPRGDMRVGLEPMRDLSERLGNPHRRFRSVHVAGTKGKGSTSALMEAALSRAGFSVGRYSSPHVEHVTERVNVGGRPISEADLARALEAALPAYKAAIAENTPGATATWFDILTVAAFLVFAEARLDWAVIEVGLGGRLDSTNVIDSDVAIITNIELEHTEILGHTRPEIAAEKAGIIKPGTLVVTALDPADPAGEVVARRAEETGCPVFWVSAPADASIADRNAALAGQALTALGEVKTVVAKLGEGAGRPLGPWLLDRATRDKARLPGRMERHDIDFKPAGTDVKSARAALPVVLDGAHVPFNLDAVLRDLTAEPDLSRPGVAVFGLASDKDAVGMIEALARYPLRPIFTEFAAPGRVKSAADLAAMAKAHGLDPLAIADPRQALARALEEAAAADGWVLVTGSLHLVGILREDVMAMEKVAVHSVA